MNYEKARALALSPFGLARIKAEGTPRHPYDVSDWRERIKRDPLWFENQLNAYIEYTYSVEPPPNVG